jgi:DNA helicase-4
MGSGIEMKITHTYRNSQELIDMAGGFIQKNTAQIQKQLISPKHLNNPVVLMEYDDSYKPDNAMTDMLETTIGRVLDEYGTDTSILLIGRYNFDSYKICITDRFSLLPDSHLKCKKYPKANVTYMTAHSSKGLGFDNVILLNMLEGKYGFPSQVENDPIMKLVQYEDTIIPFAEERRLFYVALTRTKNRVYILTPQHKPSRFLIELVNDYKIPHSDELNMQTVDLFRLRCPKCDYPLKFEFNKNYGLHLYICTNEPEVCDFMTNSPSHLYDIYQCDQCKDGYMIVNTGVYGAFYGCTNYDKKSKSGCKNKRTIYTPPLSPTNSDADKHKT